MSETIDWRDKLVRNKAGDPYPNVFNAMIALNYSPEWRNRITRSTGGSLDYIFDGEQTSRGPLEWKFAVWLQSQEIDVDPDSAVARHAIWAVLTESDPEV